MADVVRGLNGLCKLPNDIEPADNALTDELAKVPEHVANYVALFSGTTGREVVKEDLITMSERVYNFQRAAYPEDERQRAGAGTRMTQSPTVPPPGHRGGVREPRRALRQAVAEKGIDPTGMSTRRRWPRWRKYREAQYEG